MIEIKEGMDLDCAVAEAAGVIYEVIDGNVAILSLCEEDSNIAEASAYSPSTDLNDAFHAAELIGLFNVVRDGPEVHLAKTIDGQWEILTGGSEMGYVTREDTPALAICAAILKMEPLKR